MYIRDMMNDWMEHLQRQATRIDGHSQIKCTIAYYEHL
jgi:hypothetical protein